jgi:MSHA biogenesis protein MshN
MAASTVPTAATPPAPTQGTVEKKLSAQSAEQRAQSAYLQAVESMQSGRPRQALEQALDALKQYPRHPAARHLAAVLLHEQGASDRAAALLHEGLALNAHQPALSLLLARLLADQGAPGQALEVLDRHSLRNAEAEGLRGGILAQQGNFKGSLTAYEAAARQQPGNATWWLGLGVALESTSQPQQARQAYARAQALGLPSDELASHVAQRLRALE